MEELQARLAHSQHLRGKQALNFRIQTNSNPDEQIYDMVRLLLIPDA